MCSEFSDQEDEFQQDVIKIELDDTESETVPEKDILIWHTSSLSLSADSELQGTEDSLATNVGMRFLFT